MVSINFFPEYTPTLHDQNIQTWGNVSNQSDKKMFLPFL